MKMSYNAIKGFEEVRFEENYVLDIEISDTLVEIYLEMLLTEKHPLYTDPRNSYTKYCCESGKIIFTRPREVKWLEKKISPEPDGFVQYGKMNSVSCEKNVYRFEGDWGKLEIVSSEPPTLQIVSIPYYKLVGFEELYLEDSWVLDIKTTDNILEILLETVLTERHPLYSPPKPHEQYCYIRGKILFPHASKVKWIQKMMTLSGPDSDGLVEYGNINTFT